MEELIIATHNEGKVREFKSLLKDIYIVKSLSDIGWKKEIIEDKNTFEGNALKKAKTVADELGVMVIADDSGLSVDALDGKPGVYSSRYAGDKATDKDNMNKLLEDMEEIESRGANFSTTIVIYKDNNYVSFDGKVFGEIAVKPSGRSGFGYDPIFLYEDKTFAEMTQEEKNKISHRAIAIGKLIDYLTK